MSDIDIDFARFLVGARLSTFVHLALCVSLTLLGDLGSKWWINV